MARFRVEVVDDDAVFLLSERGNSVLRGHAYVRLAPLLVDGDRDDHAVVAALAGVGAGGRGVLRARPDARAWLRGRRGRAGRPGRLVGEIGVDPHDAEQRLAAATVAVIAVGDGIPPLSEPTLWQMRRYDGPCQRRVYS